MPTKKGLNQCYAITNRGRGGLVVRSRPRSLRIPGSNPDSTIDPPCMGPAACKILRTGPSSSHWCGAEIWIGRRQVRRRPNHLAAARNYESRPKRSSCCFKTGL
ncbi:hypothetical protein AVEN_126745-1 [Araneus ventricosus]|uniref:Uncharacterized protein n=1 Tax=Araneus ventricosus TaxID=182803 RepID=A0A4Y2NH87_ARAVE|nr:hypothetical protein AVEN_126745-1 [Araneus ventricosus]